jgi:RNA 2',3'-cyclic 3'-phosphodiesterase
MTSPGIRTFIAVPLPEKVRSELLAAGTALSVQLPDVRWSRKVENLHVTIKFLGQVAEERIEAVGEALGRAVRGMPRFEVDVRGMGAFPSPRRASVIWVGVTAEGDQLARIASAVEAMAAELGVGERQDQKTDRPFRAHVTVGRAPQKSKAGVDARAALAPLTDRAFGRVAVEELHLYESQLGRDGSTYVLRSRAALTSN